MVYFGGVDPRHLQEAAPGYDEARRGELDALVASRSPSREGQLPRQTPLVRLVKRDNRFGPSAGSSSPPVAELTESFSQCSPDGSKRSTWRIVEKCLIAVRLARPRWVIVIEDVDTDAAVVVSRAAERVSRAASRAIHAAGDWRVPQRS